MPSADLYDPLAALERRTQWCKYGFERSQEGWLTTVTKTNPDYLRRDLPKLVGEHPEILVFRDDRQATSTGIRPDCRVGRAFEAYVIDVTRLEAALSQPAGQSDR